MTTKLTTLQSVVVRFSLPDWICNDRFKKSKVIRYPLGHTWAGSYDRTKCWNAIQDNLLTLKDATEVSVDPAGPWIAVEFYNPRNLDHKIGVFQSKLNRLLGRYRESR